MSSGSLLILAAKSGEDTYLTGNPQISFFKSVYKKYTNFVTQLNKISIPKSNLSYTRQTICNVIIPKNGDLLSKIFIGFTLPNIYSDSDNKFRWIKYLGNNFIEKAIIYINGQQISELSGEYITICNELNLDENKKKLYYDLIGHDIILNQPEQAYSRNGYYPNSANSSSDILNYNKPPSIESRTIYTPLNFWFCNNTGLALPLISLQSSEIRIEFTFRPLYQLYQLYDSTTNTYLQPNLGNNTQSLNNFMSTKVYPAIPLNIDYDYNFNIHLEATYIHLDNAERTLFATKSHEYLIKTVKKISHNSLSPGVISLDIKAGHPVSEIIITSQRSDFQTRNDYDNYTNWPDVSRPSWQQIYYLPEYNKIAGSIEISQNSYWDYNTGNQNTIRFIRDSVSGALLVQKYYSGQYNTIYRFDSDSETNPVLPDDLINVNISQYYENQTKDIIKTLQIYLYGKQLLSEDIGRGTAFFTKLQPYIYHKSNSLEGILVHSFSLNPSDDIQPSGSANLSVINKLTLKINTVLPKQTQVGIYDYNFNFNVYLISYNILSIQAGMGGLKFAL